MRHDFELSPWVTALLFKYIQGVSFSLHFVTVCSLNE